LCTTFVGNYPYTTKAQKIKFVGVVVFEEKRFEEKL
jgi:hypothetical protein